MKPKPILLLDDDPQPDPSQLEWLLNNYQTAKSLLVNLKNQEFPDGCEIEYNNGKHTIRAKVMIDRNGQPDMLTAIMPTQTFAMCYPIQHCRRA